MFRKNSSHSTRTPYKTYSIPREFNDRIDFYLLEVRPFLLKKKKKNFRDLKKPFWLTVKGNALSAPAHLDYMKDFVNQILRRNLTIRDLRLNLNASFYDSEFAEDPESRFWFFYLMDHSEATARKYYLLYKDERMVRESSYKCHPFISALQGHDSEESSS